MTAKSSKGWLPTTALLSLILLAGGTTASAQHHGHHGYGHHGYGHGYSYSPYYYSGYSRYGYSPYYYSGYGRYGYGQLGYDSYLEPTTGVLKFQVTPKSDTKAQVYINDALASEFKHKHSLRLAPGEYRIEVRKEGYQTQNRTVRVTVGETLKLDFTLVPTAQASSAEMKPAKRNVPTAEAAAAHEPTGPVFLATRLSPSGSKLAIAAWSTEERAGDVRVYDRKKGEQPPLDRPSRTFQAEEEILAFEWAPDEESLVALTQPGGSVAQPPREIAAGIRALDLQTGSWKTVGTVNLRGGPVEVSFVDTLSWAEKTFLLNWIENARL